jgi:dihydrofolate synthase / folylpolyglutamate synthase
MTYSEAIEFLYGLQQFGTKLGLDNMRLLAALAGHPEKSLSFIHVAGTNGKGSTCAMLESIYRHAGLKTGLYTSPHLISFGERIQVGRAPLNEAQTIALVAEARAILKSFPGPHHPTFFEVVTLMALLHFREARCGIVIWETGLGGRFDATNIVDPLASVITHIHYDHQKWLGSTLPEIAREKAGIIKEGKPVISDMQERSVLEVIGNRARECGAPLRWLGPSDIERARTFRPALAGAHQLHNAALAISTVEELCARLPVPDRAIADGLQRVRWPGRLEMLETRSGQRILLDGAHNPDGARALLAALREMAPGEIGLLIGMLRDKDCAEMSEILAPCAARIYAVPVDSERTAAPEEIATQCRRANPLATVKTQNSLAEGLEAAASENLLVICGSLYLIGQALEMLGCGAEARGTERGLNEWAQPKR